MRGVRTVVLKRGKVAIETAAVVAVLLGVRIVVESLHWEFVTPGPLLTSMVAGGIFVIGLIVASTLGDFKESERVPAEMTAALAAIHEDCRGIASTKPKFDAAALDRRLHAVIAAFRDDLRIGAHSRTCLDALHELSESFLEAEALDVPPNYIVRLRGEQDTVRHAVMRVYYVQHTEFIPSAYTLIWTFLFLTIAVLTFTKSDSTAEALALLTVIDFVFIYLARLLRILDTPFRVREHTKDDVDLFLLWDFAKSLEPERPEPSA